MEPFNHYFLLDGKIMVCLYRTWAVLCVSHSVRSNSATPWTVVHQAPPSVGFSRQEYWSGLPFPSPGNLPDPGIKPRSPSLETDYLPYKPPGKLIV